MCYTIIISMCDDIVLYTASKNGDIDHIKQLFDVKHDHTISSLNHAVRLASENGHTQIVKYLCDNGATADSNNSSALRLAAMNGHLDTVIFLCENGANVTACENHAVQTAAGHGHINIVKYLHEHGAKIYTENFWGTSVAAINGYITCVEYLCTHSYDVKMLDTPTLRWVTQHGHLDVLQYCHDRGADITDGSILKTAIKHNHHDLVKYIRDHTLDISNPLKTSMTVDNLTELSDSNLNSEVI